MRRKAVVIPIGTKLADAQREIVLSTLATLDQNQSRAAVVLGISRMTVYTLLKRYKSHRPHSPRSIGMGPRRRSAEASGAAVGMNGRLKTGRSHRQDRSSRLKLDRPARGNGRGRWADEP